MTVQSARPDLRFDWIRYLGLMAVLAAVIAAGYRGFRAYVLAEDFAALNLFGIAVVAGVASFFSPCAFPLLPSYLSFYHMASGTVPAGHVDRSRPVRLGMAAALVVITFDLLLGLLIALLGTGVANGLGITGPEPNAFVRSLRLVVGAVLLVLGVGQLANWNLKPRFVEALIYGSRPRPASGRGPATALYLYGFGYTAAGMGCTGPILAGLVALTLTAGGFSTRLVAFGLYALTMGGLMLLVSALVANSNESLIRRLKAATPRIKNVAGVLLILVGVFNVYFTLNLDLFRRLLFP
jgi:cytochrome c-type biogenesis protein